MSSSRQGGSPRPAGVQCTVASATLQGVRAVPVRVEVYVSSGMPGMSIVGMPDAAVQEARERVKAAIKRCGFTMPADKIVVNLAPSSLRKTGSGFDLPIAAGILAATGQIPFSAIAGRLLTGELSLDGKVRSVRGMLAYELCARDEGWEVLCSPECDDTVAMDGVTVRAVETLQDLRAANFRPLAANGGAQMPTALDFADVAGHDYAKRAFQIAAAGGLGLLMMGPPGSGKTMLASRLPSILPPLTQEERLETALVYSIAGEPTDAPLAGARPFRAPHHGTTLAGLVGGGNPPQPGEASLAHNGVLFLDELAEFSPSVLQGIRQPMESGTVRLVRAAWKIDFPARFMLVGASNPCPCGYFGDPEIACTCPVPKVRGYQNRIGGPLMDRIDIHLDVGRTRPEELLRSGAGESSAMLREGVLAGRSFAEERIARWEMKAAGSGQAGSSLERLVAECQLTDAALRLLEDMARVSGMSARGMTRTIRIARTIADIAQRELTDDEAVCEALGYRVREGVGHGIER